MNGGAESSGVELKSGRMKKQIFAAKSIEVRNPQTKKIIENT